MIDPSDVPPVGADELLARYIVHSKHLRANATIKPDAFMPHPYLELSVTRHIQASDDELWSIGHAVAAAQSKSLYGRGDVLAAKFIAADLQVQSAPVEGNPNHANVTNWPASKPEQKAKSLQIADAARFVARPQNTSE